MVSTRRRRAQPGLFISFEGIEGSGKSTQLRRLATYLRGMGHRVIETREPGGTPMAEAIRQLFLHPPADAEPLTAPCEAYLIMAGRSQHIAHLVVPALAQGAIVLCDRFADSTMAYQGYGRKVNRDTLEAMNRFATGGLHPSLTLLLDLPVRQGLTRRAQDHQALNRLDRERLQFHTRVRRGFLELAEREPGRITLINAAHDADTVAQEIQTIVAGRLRPMRRVTTKRATSTPLAPPARRARSPK
jgi:dTMP kinase